MIQRRSPLAKLRQTAGAFVVDNAFRGLSRLGLLHPRSKPGRHKVDVVRDVPYVRDGSAAHTLDVYRPMGKAGPLPVVLYVHGGGFRILSKDTHWLMGIAFARRGYLVFNINYRLAPRHPFPAAIQDACDALAWVHANAERWGGDPERIVLAGESAGANLVTSVAVACSWRRPEPWARAVFERDIRPVAVMPACGILQVTDVGRFTRRKRIPGFVQDRLDEVAEAYLGGVDPAVADAPGGIELADPLCVIETSQPDRPLPPFFTFVGTADILLDDTRRLHAALDRLGVPCEIRYYPKEVHAFHALIWRPAAIQCWGESFKFLDQTLAT